ncbi:sensor histidine kinase [Cohnella sp. GCM10027633]|uniref:sensor histidine kinase n=1 Tax=unclassified Cohnella TaxID=2636738 RepID=UPI003636E0E6
MRAARKLLPRSLRGQLLSRMLLIVAGLLVVIGLFQFVFMERFVYQNKASAIQRQVQSIPGEIWERVNLQMRRGPGEALFFFPASTVAYIDPDGKTRVVSGLNPATEKALEPDSRKLADALRAGRSAKPVYYVKNDPDKGEQLVVLQAVRTFSREIGVVQVTTGTKPMKSELYGQLLLFVGLSALALLGSLLAFLPALRRTLVPLSRMVDTVERIDSGKLNERLADNHGQSEIDRLSHSFNGMLERLEASFLAEQEAKEQMRRFVADASHELRTPLTSIHGFLEVLLRGAAADPAQLDIALKSMFGESKRINKLVHDLLLLARLDRAPQLRLAPAELESVVTEMEPQLRLLAEGRRVELHLAPASPIKLDADKLKQVILNLFHNAVQHTDPEEGVIRLRAESTEHGVTLSVEDNGQGIPEEHLPRLFDRFYRSDASRARASGGAGLGLAISHAIVALHGGSIRVDSRPGEGSVFRVFLPSSPSRSD